MSIELSPETEKYVQEQVQSGRFASATEMLEAGVAWLMYQDSLEVVEEDDADAAAMEKSDAQITAGETSSVEEVAAEFGHQLAKGAAHNGRPVSS